MEKFSLAGKAVLLVFILTSLIAAHEKDFPVLKGPYLGQEPPGLTPVIFAPGVVSQQASVHSATVFAPDGNEVYWTVMNGPEPMRILYMQKTDSLWSQPREVPFTDSSTDANPFFGGPDSIFFKSYREGGNSIWVATRGQDGWSEPVNLDAPFSSGGLGWQASIANNGTIYFVKSTGEMGSHDIYQAEYVDGGYRSAERMEAPVNSDVDDWQVFIDPEEEYIIFGRYQHPDPSHKNGLYISFRKEDKSWSEPVNMGTAINGNHGAYWPYVTPDKKYLFFVSDMDNGNWHYDVYWVDAKIIEQLRQD